MKFRIAEKFRLEIRWDKVIYEQPGVAKLINCYLSGPVLKEVDEMNEEDYMSLDFKNQYIVFVPYYYVAKLSWKGINREPNKIYLSNAFLRNEHTNSVPKLNDNDYIVVDTSDHEDEKHQHNLVYPSYLIKETGELYKFGGK
jgi:hypothetical protein